MVSGEGAAAAADPQRTEPPAPRASGSLAAAIAAAVADLATVDPRLGLLRLAAAGTLLLGALWVFGEHPGSLAGAAALPVAALAWTLLLIATHEASHGTLLGRPRLEFALACLISWPLGWPFATYTRLHLLHHRWNGVDARDPERAEPTAEERAAAGPLRRWHQDHPFWLSAFGLGGLGLIAATYRHGLRLRGQKPGLAGAVALDATGSLLIAAALLALGHQAGAAGRVLLGWFVLERLIGALLQTRGLIEHRGLWGRHGGHLLTQLYATRTVSAGRWCNALLGGLPHHATHHAFPALPFHRLPEATRRIEQVLQEAGRPPLPRAPGYRAAVAELL